jgi:hypothetical protein
MAEFVGDDNVFPVPEFAELVAEGLFVDRVADLER